jgi:protein-tyrosine phosphatase
MLNWGNADAAPAERDAHEECRVVFLCTANRARSAIAATLLRERSEVPGLAVDSCGTSARPGAAALPEAVELARTLGVDLTGHRAQKLRPGSLATTDLVIGFERMHLDAAVAIGDVLPERAFLLLELPALFAQRTHVDADGAPGGACAVVRRLVAGRAGTGDAAEMADPRGQPRFVWREIGRLLEATVGGLAVALGERTSVSAPCEG